MKNSVLHVLQVTFFSVWKGPVAFTVQAYDYHTNSSFMFRAELWCAGVPRLESASNGRAHSRKPVHREDVNVCPNATT